jgi:hypothetical protein
MATTWFTVGIIAFLILAVICAATVIESYHRGKIRSVMAWTGMFGLTMLCIGFFVGLLVCIQKMS